MKEQTLEFRARALERARKDIDAGKLWKARDRYNGLLRTYPSNQAVLDALGEVNYRMGDTPAAGRYWFLTERDDEAATRAIDAMYERYGRTAIAFTDALPVRDSIGSFPPRVQERLRALQAAARKEGFTWEPKRRDSGRQPQPMIGPFREALTIIAVVLLTLGIWIVGLVTLGRLLVSALRALF